MKLSRIALTIGALGVAGCSGEPASRPASPATVEVRAGSETEVGLAPTPEDPTRRRRRMDLDQLDAAIRTVTGGIGWTESRGGREVSLLVELAPTLGKPDYIEIVDEDLEPSAMFQKFLDDAARSVCTRLMAVDMGRPSAERTFFVHAEPNSSLAATPEAVVANLQALLLRFHGRKVGPDAPELEPWRWLMQSAEHVTDDQAEVWRTVCVGLMTHPDFYTY